MGLADLIKKGGLKSSMTVTTETGATDTSIHEDPVADVATVTVIEPTMSPLSSEELENILKWLDFIGEKDSTIIEEVVERCANEEPVRQFYLAKAQSLREKRNADEKVRCDNCRYFSKGSYLNSHPHLGHCLQGQPESPAGLWGSDNRICDTFEPIPI